jgi:tetratricopeptide (TPR) repeat protein
VSRQTRQALEYTSRGIELEPYNANVRTSSAWASIFIGDYETAASVLARAIELDPNAAYALWTYGIVLRCLGRFDESITILESLVERSERKLPLYLALLAASRAASGENARAEEILHELQSRKGFVASIDLATIFTALGDHDAALDALERARQERNALTWARIYFPEYLPLRGDPRWQVLAQRLGRTAPVS